ncbi:MAG: hypothetical protein LUC33_05240 [Prevotellaceae bacterium]|nr:hypothetical protein [Prevotellaceae bacterium]
MPINYSLASKTASPGRKNPRRKIYAIAQCSSVFSTEEMTRWVAAHGFAGGRATVRAVLSMVTDCLKEQLLEGKRVELGELGTFYCAINSEGADSIDDFTVAGNIKGLTVRWKPGECLENLHSKARYRHVSARQSQEKAKRETKRELRDIMDKAQQAQE